MRARRASYAVRAATLTLNSQRGGQEPRDLFKKEEASAAAMNPDPLT